MTPRLLANVSCVAIDGRAVLIEGAPGSGKSTLALSLIDRGAMLVGDDGIALEQRGGQVWALPPPTIAGKLELRGIGIVTLPAGAAPLALLLALGAGGDRLPTPTRREFEGVALPCLAFDPALSAAPLRAEWALRVHGLAAG